MKLREDFFKANFTEVVPVEINGVPLYVRALTGPERTKLEQALAKLKKAGNESELNTWVAILATCDEQGNRVFKDEDWQLLHNQPTTIIDKLAVAALSASGMSPTAVDDAKKN